MWNKLEPVIVLLVALQVRGDNCPYDGHVMARKTSSLTIFNQSLAEPFDRVFNSQEDGMECKWVIEAVENSKIVRLSFPSFHLKNSSTRHTADCVAVYDGAASSVDNDELIQTICDRPPEPVYNSSGKYLTVVFRQGTQGGRRWFSMNYTMVEPVDSETDAFWSSTVGRIFSFVLIIALFGFFSFVIKSCKEGGNSLSSICGCLCDNLRSCRQGISNGVARCTNMFKSQTRASDSARSETSRSRASIVLSRSRASEDDLSINTDIVTISGLHGQEPAPNFSALFAANGVHRSVSGDLASGASAEIDTRAPPPDYSSVWSSPAPVNSESRAEDAGNEVTPPPHYASVRFSSAAPDPLVPSSLPPPPPDDRAAPPSYELPEPPSYDSLFSSSNASTA